MSSVVSGAPAVGLPQHSELGPVCVSVMEQVLHREVPLTPLKPIKPRAQNGCPAQPVTLHPTEATLTHGVGTLSFSLAKELVPSDGLSYSASCPRIPAAEPFHIGSSTSTRAPSHPTHPLLPEHSP